MSYFCKTSRQGDYNKEKLGTIENLSYDPKDCSAVVMSLAMLSIYTLGPLPKWCYRDVMLPSDLLNKHTAFSVFPLKTDLTLH